MLYGITLPVTNNVKYCVEGKNAVMVKLIEQGFFLS